MSVTFVGAVSPWRNDGIGGWYRCSFAVPKELEGQKVFLLFGGVVSRPPNVWVNAELFTRPCFLSVKSGEWWYSIAESAVASRAWSLE